MLAGLAGGGRGAGEVRRGSRGLGNRARQSPDLGEQPRGPDGAGAGQRGEDMRVGVQGELLAYLLGQGLDLLNEGGQDREQRPR